MNDLTNDGAAAPDDNDLYASVTSGAASAPREDDLDQLSNEPLAPAPPEQKEPAAKSATEPAIPPARLREESEARRAAERRAAELEGQLAAFRSQQQPKPPTVDPVDRVLSDPTKFIREEAQSLVDPFDQRMSQLTEFYSRRDAVREHGREKVSEAFQALDQAASAGDPDAIATVSRVKKSLDPFGDIVRWHLNAATLAETKGDLTAYRKRVLEEAMNDPEHVRKVVEASRQSAQRAGNTVAVPAVKAPPSLNKVGSAALPENMEDVSDADLFASTTRRKRA